MAWFKVDDAFHSHPKAMRAGTPALGLWARCGSWASQQLTDGFVPTDVALMYGTRKLVRSLVDSGLWWEVEGGYRFHDWGAQNPSREHVLAEREAAKERQRLARERAKAKREAEAEAQEKSQRESQRDSRVTSPDVQLPRPDPTRPDPKVLTEPSNSAPTVLPARTETQRSKALTDAYAEAEPMCKWPAVNGIVLKAIRSGKFADDEIGAALLRLAAENRSVTVDSLRYELQGMPAGRASPSNMEQHLALTRRLDAGSFPQGEIA